VEKDRKQSVAAAIGQSPCCPYRERFFCACSLSSHSASPRHYTPSRTIRIRSRPIHYWCDRSITIAVGDTSRVWSAPERRVSRYQSCLRLRR